jgi:hypothetical protein
MCSLLPVAMMLERAMCVTAGGRKPFAIAKMHWQSG